MPSHWVATKGRAKGNTLVNKQTNSFLDQMEYTLHDLTLQIQREGKQVSAKEILDRYKYLNAPKPKTGILALYAEHNQELKELVDISVALATYKSAQERPDRDHPSDSGCFITGNDPGSAVSVSSWNPGSRIFQQSAVCRDLQTL